MKSQIFVFLFSVLAYEDYHIRYRIRSPTRSHVLMLHPCSIEGHYKHALYSVAGKLQDCPKPPMKGVYWDKSKQKWRSTISVGGTLFSLITTPNKGEAIIYRTVAEQIFRGRLRTRDDGPVVASKVCPACSETFYRQLTPALEGKYNWRTRKFCCAQCSYEYRRGRSVNVGNANNQWKGDAVGYSGIHRWVHRQKPKPLRCEACNQPKRLEAANISQLYKRDVNDWEYLCRICHMRKDGRSAKLAKIGLQNLTKLRGN